MKYFLIINLILNCASVFAAEVSKKIEVREVIIERSGASPDSDLKKKFLKETKIELGEYKRTANSDTKCLEGPLFIIDLGEELNLMLGARSLAGSIGKEKYEEKDGDCVMTYESSYNDVAIKERVEQVCGQEKTTFHTTVTLEKNKISYVKEAYAADKLVDTLKCTIVKK